MASALQSALDEAVRSDFVNFICRVFQTVTPGTQKYLHNWHIEHMAAYLEMCRKHEINQLLITLPPRYLKSITTSVAFPAFVMGHEPTSRFICASYSQTLADKHARDFRRVLESNWYRSAFPHTRINPRKNTEGEMETTAGGFRYSTSVGGTLTGRGGNYIIIDDPMKADDAASKTAREAVLEWYRNTLVSRLDDKENGVKVLVMQRLHVDDLASLFIPYDHVELPAIAEKDEKLYLGKDHLGHDVWHERRTGDVLHPQFESRERLEEIKELIGSNHFWAQYQQKPVQPDGNLVKMKWFGRYQQPPRPTPSSTIVQSWDTAMKGGVSNDYSVCTTWFVEKNAYYLLDVFRKQLEFPDLIRAAVSLKKKFRPDSILIEDAGSGTPLIQALRREHSIWPIARKPDKDKLTRFDAHSATIEAGQVHLPVSAPWLDDFTREIMEFPKGKHDDQADSMSQFLTWVKRPNGITITEAGGLF